MPPPPPLLPMKLASLRRWLLAGTFVLLLPAPGRTQGVPPLLNYQGRVVVGGTNFSGQGQFKFALVNSAGTTTYWSNDGTSTAGSEPARAVTLTVTGGLYSLGLGDAALANMTALPASVFAGNADVRLRVWFNDGTNGSQILSPDQRIGSVGYAQLAATVPDGSITSAKLGAGAVTAGNLAGGVAGTYQTASGATAAQANTSYAATGTSPVSFTLPATANVGDVVTIAGTGTGGWSLTPGQGQSVFTNDKLAFRWTTVPGTDLNRQSGWTSVACSADGSHVIVCRPAQSAAVRVSTNYGATFTADGTLQNGDFVAVAASADFTHLVAASDALGSSTSSAIYVSTNAGATWAAAANTSGINWSAAASSADGSRLVATVGGGSIYTGGIYTSADAGVTWTATNAPSAVWSAVASSADGTRLVATQSHYANGASAGLIYRSADAGATWTATSAPSLAWTSVVSSADGSHLAAAGYTTDLEIYLSADAGATWTLARNVPGSALASSADGVHLAAFGYDNAYTSADAGASWTSSPTNGTGNGYSAAASSADGVHLVATETYDSIHMGVGALTAAQGSATQFQYLGNGRWGTLNQTSLAAGSVGNTQLANPSLTINTGAGLSGGGPVALGGTITLGTNATAANTPSTLVSRDASGNFSAGTITASLSGNATNATTANNANALGGMNATSTNTASSVVSRDAGGGFSAGSITSTNSAANVLAFDAEGAVAYGTWLRLGNSAAGGRIWNLISSAGGNGEGGGKLLFNDGTSNTTRMVLDSSSRLGIGQVPVTNALEVSGDASKSTAGSWLANSDRRIKTVIHPLAGALDLLDRLNPVGFHYTPEYRATHPEIPDVEYFNVIAQEFREVFPDAVHGSGERLPDGSEILQVDTYPALIESLAAVKELHGLCKAQGETLQKQAAEIQRLRREAEQQAADYDVRLQRLERAAGIPAAVVP